MENLAGGSYIKNNVQVKANMALVFNGVGTMDNYIRGIMPYERNSKNITFSSSGGITLSFGGKGISGVKPFDTQNFDLKGIKIFGAVKYNGKWKGVRIYKDE